MKILAYPRENGTFGLRNHVLVMPTVVCANRTVSMIREQVKDCAAVEHVYGCNFDLSANQLLEKTVIGYASNPNVGAVILISLGCETLCMETVAAGVARTGKPVEMLRIQEIGGTLKTAERGVELVARLRRHIEPIKREPADFSELVLAVECGGSDAFSGLSANPAVGAAADRVVDAGGTVLMSESPEIVGAETGLARRAVNEEVQRQFLNIVSSAERGLARSASEADGVYLASGNIEGGLSSIEEKSLGCVRKGGTRPLSGTARYGERPGTKGFVVMDTPGHDIMSMTGKFAGGAQIMCFTTGRGSPTGCAIAPVIKVASNTPLYHHMSDDMDVNAGTIIDGAESIDQVGQRIFDSLVHVANGELTRSEVYGHNEFAVAGVSNYEHDCQQQERGEPYFARFRAA